MAATMSDKRGPKLGDAASLWNFTASPGWTADEAATLKLCLLALGVGRWAQIQACGLLPGKMVQQLNGQTQRLLGQQSLAAYTGLQVDIDRIRIDNEARTGPDVERKGGLIIHSGAAPTKAVKDAWQAAAKARYGLTASQKVAVEAEFRERVEAAARAAPRAAQLMASDAASLPRPAKLDLLVRLHAKAGELAGLLGTATGTTAARAVAASAKAAAAAAAVAEAAAGDDGDAAAAAGPAEPPGALAEAAAVNGGDAGPPAEADAAPAPGPAPAPEPAPAPAPAPAPPPKKKRPAAGGGKKKAGTKRKGGGGGAPGSPDLSAAVDTVAAMGFPRRKAAEALAEVGGNVSLALEWLCSNCL